MKRSTVLGAIGAFFAVTGAGTTRLLAAADAPSAPLSPAETRFVTAIRADLGQRFPTPADAERGGYHRFTNEDATGAISYVNLVWDSTDPKVPAQLWYDVRGRLLGADYSMLQSSSPTAPSIFGINPSRFHKLPAHIHYVLRNADGSMTYSRAIHYADYAAVGDAQHPTADGLVKAGVVKSASQVAFVFLYPAIWDTSVWLVPNPSGAFADANPDVHPSKPPSANDQG